MAELFLQDLQPEFISRPTTHDVGYDLLVGFANDLGGINTFAVQVKGTERPLAGRYQILRRQFERFAYSNIPGLLLVADVKKNELHYAWLNTRKASGAASIAIPLTKLDDAAASKLQAQLRAASGRVAATG